MAGFWRAGGVGGGQGYIPGSLGSCTARYGKTQGGGLWGEDNYATILLSR